MNKYSEHVFAVTGVFLFLTGFSFCMLLSVGSLIPVVIAVNGESEVWPLISTRALTVKPGQVWSWMDDPAHIRKQIRAVKDGNVIWVFEGNDNEHTDTASKFVLFYRLRDK